MRIAQMGTFAPRQSAKRLGGKVTGSRLGHTSTITSAVRDNETETEQESDVEMFVQ